VKVGVLALQGAFREHAEALSALEVDVTLVKRPEQLESVDALVLPGGESTTIDKLLDSSELRAPLTARLRDGMPALLTCAGLIVCATEVIDGRADQAPLGVLDVTVRRNGYGRQRESFEAPLAVRGIDDVPFPGVFIRAPVIERVGPLVDVLAVYDDAPVVGRERAIFFVTFHPELSGDLRLHQLFVNEVS
jgi:5'-phosphate synthase pdxT subunit